MDLGTADVDSTGPIFISYRQSDGTEIVQELAWLLRAAGLPVWRDRDDLPPGDTNERLKQAIDEGISGGVLVITPDIRHSKVVKTVEAPRLLRLHQMYQAFALGIANAVQQDSGGLDYHAPDRLLSLDSETLRGVDQQPTDRQGLQQLLQRLLWNRIACQRDRVETDAHTFSLSVQTRNTPQVYDRTGCQLDIRVRPSEHERLPGAAGLTDLQHTLGLLPDAVTRSGAQRVRIHGGAHLSVAFAVGTALPSTRIGAIEVVDQRGVIWASGSEAQHSRVPYIRVADQETSLNTSQRARPTVAVYLDLLPQRSGAAFERFLAEHAGSIHAWRHLTSTCGELLDPAEAGAIASDVAAHIRSFSNDNDNATVHLLLRCPFPLALLLGRLTNTIRFVAYEWDDSQAATGDDFRPRYVPALRVRASALSGPIDEVLLD
jgi:hypothetical protein